MPGIFHEPISRKRFFKTSTMLATGLLTNARTSHCQEESQQQQSVHVALLSDTHLPADETNEFRGFRPVENLNKVIPQVVDAKPDVAIINGDIARLTGEEADYLALKPMIAPLAEIAPIHMGLGNHDHRENFFKVFPQGDEPALVNGKHVSILELGGTRFVILDSLLYVDKVAGLLGKSQRDWLTQFLQDSDDRPTVFFIHHSLGDEDVDLLDYDRVFKIMQPHRKVKAIFYGHSHQYKIEQREHIYLINQPAIGYNFTDDQPVGWLDATFAPAGVRLTLHAIGGNVEGDTGTREVGWS